MSAESLRSNAHRAATRLAEPNLLWPIILLIWCIPFITISEPEDWKASRFGTTPILPPTVIKAIKILGRGGAIGLLGFSILSVWRHRNSTFAFGALWPLLAFGAFGVLSTVWSPLKSISLTQSMTFVMLLMLAFYTSIVWRNDEDTLTLVKHLVLAFVTVSCMLMLLRFGLPRSGALTKESSGVLHSTNAGATGGLCLLLLLSARILWNRPWSTWWLPVALLEVVMMLVSGNRLSVVVTFISISLLFLLRLNRAVVAFCMLLFVVPASVYLLADPRIEVLEKAGKGLGVLAKQGQTKSELSSLSGRAEMWSKIWDSFLESPYFGHGFFVTSDNGRIYVWHEWGNWTAHNLWLQVLATTGVIGAGLLVLGIGLLSGMAITGSRYLKGIDGTCVLLVCLACWFFGWGMLNSSFVGPLQPESLVFALLIGIAGGVSVNATLSRLRGNSALPSPTQSRVQS